MDGQIAWQEVHENEIGLARRFLKNEIVSENNSKYNLQYFTFLFAREKKHFFNRKQFHLKHGNLNSILKTFNGLKFKSLNVFKIEF